jgi:DNA repair exonuclease SbcCD nuclease subunit
MLQEELEVPVLIAGDIFDRWNSPPELINFAMKYLPDGGHHGPETYTIPGQHDLPLHNYEDMEKSAYGVLKRAGTIKDLPTNTEIWSNQYLAVRGFPWGYPLQECDSTFGGLKVALVHDYRWIEGCGYPTAPEDKKFGKRVAGVDDKGKWLGWDVVVYGDNHKGFIHRIENTVIFNCGSLMRRHSDQADYKPMVGLLTKEGNVLPHYLDISGEKHLESLENVSEKETVDLSDFFNELQKLGDSSLDFVQTIKRYMTEENLKKAVRAIVEEVLE